MSTIDPLAYAALQRNMFTLLDHVLETNARLLNPDMVNPHVAAVVFTVIGKLYAEDMAHVVDHPEAQRWIADLYAASRKQLRAVSETEDH
jgi:hypothetical protein